MNSRRQIVLLNRFYWPDVAATGQMLTDLAEDLAAQGWDVTVVTSRIGYAVDGGELPREERRNGVRIIRVNTTRFGRDRLLGRLGDYASYFAGAFWRLLRLPTPDVVVALSDPPLLLAPALVAGRLRGFRTVYWLQDLYPHLAGKLDVLKESGVIYRAFGRIAHRLHAAADGIITLGPQMSRTMIASGARAERTAHVHNWADAAAIQPVPPEANPFLREHALTGKFVVLYSGNAGRAHAFDATVEAMRQLRDDPDVVFLFIGGGKQLPVIRATVEREALTNVRFLDYLPREQLRYSLSAASVSLVTENPEVVGLLVPSKTYGILASGRPLLFVGARESDVAAVVRDADCGVVISPDDPQALVAAIRRLRDDPAEAEAMGRRGRMAAERRYDRRIATQRWGDVLESLMAGHDPRATQPSGSPPRDSVGNGVEPPPSGAADRVALPRKP